MIQRYRPYTWPRRVRAKLVRLSRVYEVRDMLPLLCVLSEQGSVTDRYDPPVCALVGGASLSFTLLVYTASG